MLRSTIVAGTAFAAGLVAGITLGQDMSTSTELTDRQFHPSALEQARALASDQPGIATARSEPRPKANLATAADSTTSRAHAERSPAPDVVIIRASKPAAADKPQMDVSPKTADVKIAHIGSSESALTDNAIVRRELTRDIQSELYRAGCRSVVISGRWDHRTVKASAQFVANRNAILPANRPDVVLLGLLRSYDGRSCGLSNAATTAALTPAAAALLANEGGASGDDVVQERIGSRQVSPRSAERRRQATRQATRQARRRRAALQRKQRKSWRRELRGFSLD